ncbi:hypothetical protein [Trichloromonas sp.]|uniref:hypothetical protein n=1 Tax=Trichloromonas sp. TaxID=3069249 RepID=UPI002A44C029|nr:hypothetical protein [Trichloromonas sp.]
MKTDVPPTVNDVGEEEIEIDAAEAWSEICIVKSLLASSTEEVRTTSPSTSLEPESVRSQSEEFQRMQISY